MKFRAFPQAAEHSGQSTASGFALVATISIIVLLALIAIGLLSLSTTAVRASAADSAQLEAKANARLALALAIGELQKSVGSDRRITAPASVVEDSKSAANPHWVGVWEAKEKGEAPDYDPGRPANFQRWLVSHRDADSLDTVKRSLRDRNEGVELAKGTDQIPSVRAGLIPVGERRGHYAWWVGDESMKARVNLAATPNVVDRDALLAQRSAAIRTSPESIEGLEGVDPEIQHRLLTTDTVRIATAGVKPHALPPLREFLTANSRSLAVDVVEGGFKRDINALFELPEDRIDNAEYGIWDGKAAYSSAKAHLYGRPGNTLGARWNHLYAYYNLYKQSEFQRDEPVLKPKGQLIDWHLADQYQDFGDPAGGFRFPRIAKIIYVFSYSSTKGANGKYKLALVTDVFLTAWNPYNSKILFPNSTSMFVKLSKDLPMSFEWRIDGRVKGNTRLGEMFGGHPFLCQAPMKTSRSNRVPFEMDPGETLVFTMTSARRPVDIGTGSSSEPFYPGVGYRGGFLTTKVLGNGKELEAPGSGRVSVSLKPRNDASAYNIGGVATSQYVDFWIYDNARGWPYYEHRGEIIARSDTPFTRRMPEISHTDVRSVSMAEVAGRKQPFGAFLMEIKTAADSVEPSLAFLHSGISRLSIHDIRSGGVGSATKRSLTRSCPVVPPRPCRTKPTR